MLQLKKSTGIRADRPCIRYGCTTCGTRALKGQGGLHPHICTNCKRNSAAGGGRRPRSAHLRDISPDGWGQRHPRLHGSFIASWPARGWRNDAPTTMQPQGRLDNFNNFFNYFFKGQPQIITRHPETQGIYTQPAPDQRVLNGGRRGALNPPVNRAANPSIDGDAQPHRWIKTQPGTAAAQW